MPQSRMLRPSALRAASLLTLCWSLAATAPAAAHTVDAAEPFHLSARDYFVATVGGAGAFSLPDVSVELVPVGGGAPVAATAVELVAATEVGVRLPATIPAGQYEVTLDLAGTPQDAPGPHLWIRGRTLRLIKKTLANETFSYVPPGADFKEADLVDLDGDGALDVYAANSAGASDVDMLFVSQANKPAPAGAHRLRVRLRGSPGNPRGLGARLILETDGPATSRQVRQVVANRGYLSASEAVPTFGLGAARRAARLEVRWPSGRERVYRDLPGDRDVVLFE